MDLILLLITLLAGVIVGLFMRPSVNRLAKTAKFYLAFSILIAFIYWACLATFQISFLNSILTNILKYLGFISNILLTFLLVNIFFTLRQVPDKSALKNINNSTLWGISIIIGNVFLVATVGKMMNFKFMADFFISSGYSLWFLYFIMAAETLGGLGILLHFKLKTGVLASLCLLIIMLGAVYTHLHNRDPFSDSYSALKLIIILVIMQLVYSFQKKIVAIK